MKRLDEVGPTLQDLNDSMQSHLRLHFNNEEASDEQVSSLLELNCGPSTVALGMTDALQLKADAF